MAVVFLLLVAAAGLAGPAAAQQPNQAGLVVLFGEDRVETRCVAFEGDEIAGNDLLARSGLDLVIDATSGLGITVCRIEGQGCAFPAEHCFCQCMGGEGCRYWNYFYREPGDEAWTYSPLGVLLRQVPPGGVEAWVWGDGSTPPDEALTFEAICAPAPGPGETPAATPTLPPAQAPTSPPAAGPSPAMVVAATASPTASAPPTAQPAATRIPPSPTAVVSPTAALAGSTAELSSYLFFGLLVLGLSLIGVVVWLRHR